MASRMRTTVGDVLLLRVDGEPVGTATRQPVLNAD